MSPNPRIILIEDDREIVRALSIRLRAVGYEIIAAYDGAAGVATATEINPDVIVLDIRMRGIDGLAARSKLRQQESTRHLPVLIHSANVTEKIKTAAFELGSEYVMQKRCDASILFQANQVTIAKSSKQLN